jgi:hypothetical protein
MCHIVTTNVQTPSITRSPNPGERYWETSDPANLLAVSSGLFPCLLKPAQMENGKVDGEGRKHIPMEITEKYVTVSHDAPCLPPGFRSLCPWREVLREYYEPMLYPYIGRRENIRPSCTTLREHNVRCFENEDKYVLDRYVRIGNNYICSRVYKGNTRLETLTFPMHVGEELKEEIAAKAMHPKRLRKWLENGWEEEWYQYFS